MSRRYVSPTRTHRRVAGFWASVATGAGSGALAGECPKDYVRARRAPRRKAPSSMLLSIRDSPAAPSSALDEGGRPAVVGVNHAILFTGGATPVASISSASSVADIRDAVAKKSPAIEAALAQFAKAKSSGRPRRALRHAQPVGPQGPADADHGGDQRQRARDRDRVRRRRARTGSRHALRIAEGQAGRHVRARRSRRHGRRDHHQTRQGRRPRPRRVRERRLPLRSEGLGPLRHPRQGRRQGRRPHRRLDRRSRR